VTTDAELVAGGARRREAWARVEVARLVAESGQFSAGAEVLEADYVRALQVWESALADESKLALERYGEPLTSDDADDEAAWLRIDLERGR
jgi:hypothetical protein